HGVIDRPRDDVGRVRSRRGSRGPPRSSGGDVEFHFGGFGKARQRTYDAMARKARAGHVTGGRVFGYDNVEIQGPDGRRSHVERKVNDKEAAAVVRIFEMSAAGVGATSIAEALNREAVQSPRAQCGRSQ